MSRSWWPNKGKVPSAVPSRRLTREEQIAEVNEMCEEIKLIRAGKLKGRPAEELLRRNGVL